jgi:hypothetical protein
MKTMIVLLLVPFLISSCLYLTQDCRSLETTPSKEVELKESELHYEQKDFLKFKKCTGFFLKPSVNLPNNINFFTISSINKFKNLLGIAKTMSNAIVTPNFNESILLIIAEKSLLNLHNIIINQVYMKDNNIYIEYEIKEQESNNGYFVQNLGVFEIEKPSVVLNVYFINKDNKAFVVAFGNRYNKSPVDIPDMLEHYTGIYKGILPAVNSNKILTELSLNPDYSYTLKQEYLVDNGRVFESSGKWYPSVDISSFALNKNKDLIFYFINRNTIEKLGINGERLESNDYILKK